MSRLNAWCRTTGLLLFALGCAPSLPGPSGARPVAVRPDTLWSPPAQRTRPEPPAAEARRDLPPGIAERRTALTLEDVIALALEGSPLARESWANARSQAAAYGAARGTWFPTIQGTGTVTRLKTAAILGRNAVTQTVYQPSASFTYLLLDLGGRSGQVRAAREALVAANWTHNSTLQNVVATTAAAFFDYTAAKGLLAAQRSVVAQADTNLAAAEERRKVGVATIADVLQARTALAQARLDLQTVEGNLLTTRGALAVATGFPANLEYDVDTTIVERDLSVVTDSVDAIIAQAVRERPDLAAAQAEYEQARARISVTRSQRLPSITSSGNFGYTKVAGQPGSWADSYTLTLGLQIPLFNGFTWEYNQQAAQADADAARARAEGLRQQVVFEVFRSYYALRTSIARVTSADELLRSAEQSAEAARGRYQGGVGSLIELLSAETALANARAQRIQARLGWQAALVQLSRDAGLLDLQGQSPLHLAPSSTPNDSLP
jgi:outer membrane protein TolC